jgi:hypothetical protein
LAERQAERIHDADIAPRKLIARACMRNYRRARPKVSFALATAMLIILALTLTGILRFNFDLSLIDTNPQSVAVAVVFSIMAVLLLYEW